MNFDFNSYTKNLINKDDFTEYLKMESEIKKYFSKHSDDLYWYDINSYINNYEINQMIDLASYFKKNSDVILIVGIGGSSNSAKGIISALTPYFKDDTPEIIFVGDNLSSEYLLDLKEYILNKDFSINVISKSGNTMETLLVFEFIKDLMETKYNDEEIRNRIVITTGSNNGTLNNYAKKYGFKKLYIPEEIGGRYSVFTPVTLFPMAIANLDIKAFLRGGLKGKSYVEEAFKYATFRNIFFRKNKFVEGLIICEGKLSNLTEWIKQVLAESEGKNKKGILPVKLMYTKDLHSLGQFIQEGNPILFETVISVSKTKSFKIEKYRKTLTEIIELIKKSVAISHLENNCPSLIISFKKVNEYYLGQLMMFFMMSAFVSSYLFKVNPFDQPGVKKYKDLLNSYLNQK